MNASSRIPKSKRFWVLVQDEIAQSDQQVLGTFVFLLTVVFGSQWVKLFERILPVSYFNLLKTPLLLSWVFITCVLCLMSLRAGSFNPWSVLYAKLPFTRKVVRVLLQSVTAIAFALLVSVLDGVFKTDFDREFLGNIALDFLPCYC